MKKWKNGKLEVQKILRVLVSLPETLSPSLSVGFGNGLLLELLLFPLQTFDLDSPEHGFRLQPLHLLVEPLPFHVVLVGHRESPLNVRELGIDLCSLRFCVIQLDLVLLHFSWQTFVPGIPLELSTCVKGCVTQNKQSFPSKVSRPFLGGKFKKNEMFVGNFFVATPH